MAWTRKSPSRRVLELLDQEFHVQVPADLCGIELEDMFVDAETGRRFFYAPTNGSVHFLDRETSHREIGEEVWRCGFHITQNLWQRCATLCFDGLLPFHHQFQSAYLPDPAWSHGRTDSICSSAAFARQMCKAFLKTGLRRVDASQHTIYDVRLLVKSLLSFLDENNRGQTNRWFGWKGFFMDRQRRVHAPCTCNDSLHFLVVVKV